jgi:hypothetical protein
MDLYAVETLERGLDPASICHCLSYRFEKYDEYGLGDSLAGRTRHYADDRYPTLQKV